MARLKSKIQGKGFRDLTDKQVRFVLEYPLDYKPGAAAIRAGYSAKCASQTAQKLLDPKLHPEIIRALARMEKKDQKKFEIDRETILKHLASCATRDGRQFVDEKGRLIGSVFIRNGEVKKGLRINDLPKDVTRAIDEIKQKRKCYTLDDGTEVEEIETVLKLTSKNQAIDMAMRHRNLFPPHQVEALIGVTQVGQEFWDQLGGAESVADPGEERILEIAAKAVTKEE